MLANLLLSFLATFFDAAPWIVVGFLVAGFVNVFISKEALLRYLGGRGFWPIVRSIFVGLGLPICSCGVVPIAVGLHKRGAPVGSTLAFLVSAPAMSPAAAFTMWVLLGPKIASAYVGCVATSALLIALIGNRLFPSPPLPPAAKRTEPVIIARFSRRNLTKMLDFALHDYGAEVSFDILFGLLLASAAFSLVPHHWIAQHLGVSDFRTYLIISAIASPLYVCTLPSIPVVRNLIALGMVPGAAITYLMGGTATNYGELRALSRQMSRPVAFYFFFSVMICGLLSGLLVDRLVLGISADTRAYAPMASFLPTLLRPENESLASLSWTQIVFRSFGSLVLGYVLVSGSVRHARRVWANPCQVCAFWARSMNVKEFRACDKPCWLAHGVQKLHQIRLPERHPRATPPRCPS